MSGYLAAAAGLRQTRKLAPGAAAHRRRAGSLSATAKVCAWSPGRSVTGWLEERFAKTDHPSRHRPWVLRRMGFSRQKAAPEPRVCREGTPQAQERLRDGPLLVLNKGALATSLKATAAAASRQAPTAVVHHSCPEALMWGTDGVRVCHRWTTAGAGSSPPSSIGTPSQIGWHVCKRGDRFAALQPISMGLAGLYGVDRGRRGSGAGNLRMDHGSQYLSDHFTDTLDQVLGHPAVLTPSSPSPSWHDERRRAVQSSR